jgi:hypothetical protein
MINQVYTGTPTSRRQVTLPAAMLASPSTYPGGTPILVGTEPAFTLDQPQTAISGCTCLFNGTFATTIVAQSSESPATGSAIKPGDALYANGGTLDSATNVTYGFTIDKHTAGTAFGHADPTYAGLGSGLTDTAGLVQI